MVEGGTKHRVHVYEWDRKTEKNNNTEIRLK